MMNVFEKIREKLEELCEQTYYNSVNGNRNEGIRNNAYHNAIEIINQVEQDYNSGWILCDKELPQYPQENPIFDGKQLELYLVCTTYTDYPFRSFWNGKFFADGMSRIEDVIAWMPLPQPYKESDLNGD